jgi:peptidoglycan/LPS O-acetylase OafA/YrhL
MILASYAARNLPFHAEFVRAMIAYGALSSATGTSAIGRYFAQGGDYSYGLYLYGWPVTQSIVHAIPGIKVVELLALALPATAILAAGSWHFIEKTKLQTKSAPPLLAGRPKRVSVSRQSLPSS